MRDVLTQAIKDILRIYIASSTYEEVRKIRESYVKRRAKEVLYYKITSNFFYNAAIDSDRSPGLKFSPEV